MAAPTHCLLITALVLSIISWIAGIIALASPEWYVIDSTDGKTRIGAFKLCYPDSSGSEVCENAASKSFSFPECDRSSSELSSRFGVVQGLGIAGIILAVLATAVLVAATVRGCQRTRVEEEAERRRLRNEPGYMPTPTNGGRPGQGRTQQNDSTSSQEITELDRRVPRLDIIAAILLLLSIAVYCASCFYFLKVITAWLFCDEKPCTYLTSTGTAGCTDGMGWTFALIIIAWIAGLIALMAIGFRWFLRPATEEGVSNGDSNGSQTNNTNHHRAVPSNDEEMRSRQPPRQKEQPPAAVASNSGPTHAPTIISTINPMLNVTNDNTASRATSSAAQQQQSSSSPFRARKPGEPVCDLPEGNWDWDESSQLFWSEEQQYFWDHNSGHFYEPESGQWFDPVNDKWYSL